MTDTQTGTDLLRFICERPDDDTVRLIYCDWLEEHGQQDRSDFIRVQCELAKLESARYGNQIFHMQALRLRERELLRSGCLRWFGVGPGEIMSGNLIPLMPWGRQGVPNTLSMLGVVRRGFVHTVRCRLGDFYPLKCRRCNGSGRDQRESTEGDCPACSGTGRTPGLRPKIMWDGEHGHPVERAEVADKEPYETDSSGWRWWNEADDDVPPYTENIPYPIFNFLSNTNKSTHERLYPTREAAVSDLSQALVRWARREAGLPEWEGG